MPERDPFFDVPLQKKALNKMFKFGEKSGKTLHNILVL